MNQQDGNEIRMSADALIALVMAEAEAREMAAMPGPEAMGAAFQPSQRFEKKMRRLLRQARWKKKKREALRAARRMFVVVTTVVTVFTCMLMPARAVREAVVSTVMNWREQFVEVVFEHEEENDVLCLPLRVILTYIPEGFVVTEENIVDGTRFYAEYQKAKKDWFVVRILPVERDQAVALDNEYTSYYQMRFDDTDAIWGIMKDESNELVWQDNGWSFHISSNFGLQEIMKIADGIEFYTEGS